MPNYIIAIDPGPEQSAVVSYVPAESRIEHAEIYPNDVMLMEVIDAAGIPGQAVCVIEYLSCYGQRVGREVFDTCRWVGRFQQAWTKRHGGPAELIERRHIKKHLTDNKPGGDAAIRAVLIDRFGPGKAKAIGNKANPGPLHGIKSHMWAALACAVTWADTKGESDA